MATLRTAPSDRDPDVQRMFAAGATDAEIAAELDVTADTVRQDRRYLGLQRRPTPSAPVADARLVELHSQGLRNTELAETTGLTRRSVEERLYRLGLRSHR